MSKIEKAFKKNGWDASSWDYSSRDKTISEHGADLAKALAKKANEHPNEPISFVTHSMGGLVLRAALNHPDCPPEAKQGRAVLLSPPNKGALLGRKLSSLKLVQKVAGPRAGSELLTTENGGFDHLGEFPLSMEVLIIGGSLLSHPILPEMSDGTVMVSEMALSTPYLLQTVDVLHSFMPSSGCVIRRTLRFLKDAE